MSRESSTGGIEAASPSGGAPPSVPGPEGRARMLLGLGAMLGLLGAILSLLLPEVPSDPGLPPGAVARVEGELISLEAYQRALEALARDRRNPLEDTDRRRILDRLIEEELLIRRAIELGFVRHDRRVRADLVTSLIEAVVSEATSAAQTPEQLEAFYQEQLDYFTQPGRVRVREILVRVGSMRSPEEARARAWEVTRRLRAEEDFSRVRRELGDPEVASLPDDLLTPTKLRQYLGPTAARTALEIEPGGISDPVRTAAGFRVMQVLVREPARIPPLREIETEVRAELRRRAGDEALRAYIEALRENADIRIAETIP